MPPKQQVSFTARLILMLRYLPYSRMTPSRSYRDNYRGFFEQCFAQLLKHIFGYDGSSWLDHAAQACSPPPPCFKTLPTGNKIYP